MAKEETQTSKSGEQGNLIEVQPENAEALIKAAKLYKKFQLTRLTALKKEKDQQVAPQNADG